MIAVAGCPAFPPCLLAWGVWAFQGLSTLLLLLLLQARRLGCMGLLRSPGVVPGGG